MSNSRNSIQGISDVDSLRRSTSLYPVRKKKKRKRHPKQQTHRCRILEWRLDLGLPEEDIAPAGAPQHPLERGYPLA